MSFTIDTASGQIKTTGVTYNFEATKKSYTVTVNVHDGKDAAGGTDTSTIDDSITVTINLTNVNEAPTITAGDSGLSTPENALPETAVITVFAASDPDMPDTKTWSVESDHDGDLFQISSGGSLRFDASPDFETPLQTGPNDNEYRVKVKVTDTGGLTATRTVTLTVTNVNEAPVFDTEPDDFNVNENTATTTIIQTYSATDVDANTTLTWSLDGEDKNDFVITRNTVTGDGELRFAAVPNFEDPVDDDDIDAFDPDNAYEISVGVEDNESSPLGDSKAITITVVDVNDVPVVSWGATPDFAEIEFDVDGMDLDGMDLTVATYAAADEDVGDTTVAWSLTGADANHFTITVDADGDGVLRFKNPTPSTAPPLKPADYENPRDAGSGNDYVIVVRATDANSLGPLTGTFAVTVTVTPVNETPEVTGSAAPSFVEIEWDADPMAVDLTVATYTARDEETETITWSRAGTDSSAFTIDPSSGVLSFVNPPNYEMPTDADTDNGVYEIIVKARDTALNTRDYPVTVTVTNVDETPEITNPPAPISPTSRRRPTTRTSIAESSPPSPPATRRARTSPGLSPRATPASSTSRRTRAARA